MDTVTSTTESRAPDADDSGPRRFNTGLRSRLWWWLPVALAAVYALALIPELPAIISHTWWSADSASAGVVAQLYSHPPAGQFIVLGNHGWYETLSFDLLTRGLAGHRLLWYLVPVAVWVMTITLIGVGIGLAGAFGLTRLIATQLFAVKATDPATFLTVTFVLVAVAVAATLVPALRATRIDPLTALREE